MYYDTRVINSFFFFWINLILFLKDMVPPKDPYIKIRVVEEIDQGIVMSDKTTSFTRHSMHFLKRTDAQPYIARVISFTCFLPKPINLSAL